MERLEQHARTLRGVAPAELDGRQLAGGGATIALVDDGGTHRVRVVPG